MGDEVMARIVADDRAELRWDELALLAAASVTDERAQEHDPLLQVRGLMPSLYLSLARAGAAAGAPPPS